MPPPARQSRSRRRRSIWGTGTLRVLVIFVGLVASFATGTPQMAATVATRLATGQGPACAVVRVSDGDTVILHCHPARFERVDIAGYDTPELFLAQCLDEAKLGLVARWQLQLGLWNATDITIERRGATAEGRGLIRLRLDGRDVRHRMATRGHGIYPQGLARLRQPQAAPAARWCPNGRFV